MINMKNAPTNTVLNTNTRSVNMSAQPKHSLASKMFNVMPLSKSTRINVIVATRAVYSSKTVESTTLKSGPLARPIKIMKSDSGTFVYLKTMRPTNPIKMMPPKIRSSFKNRSCLHYERERVFRIYKSVFYHHEFDVTIWLDTFMYRFTSLFSSYRPYELSFF